MHRIYILNEALARNNCTPFGCLTQMFRQYSPILPTGWLQSLQGAPSPTVTLICTLYFMVSSMICTEYFSLVKPLIGRWMKKNSRCYLWTSSFTSQCVVTMVSTRCAAVSDICLWIIIAYNSSDYCLHHHLSWSHKWNLWDWTQVFSTGFLSCNLQTAIWKSN